MHRIRPTVAILESLLIVPATLFMVALFLRAVQPIMGTGHLVDWFSRHVRIGLDLFLVAMPLAALIIGSALVLCSWRSNAVFRHDTLEFFALLRANMAPLAVMISTVMAGAILAIVAMHMITE